MDISPSEVCMSFLFNYTSLFISYLSLPLMLLLIWPTCTPRSALEKRRKSKNKLVTAIPVDETPGALEHSPFFSPFIPSSLHLQFSFHLFTLSWSLFSSCRFFSVLHLLLYQFPSLQGERETPNHSLNPNLHPLDSCKARRLQAC